VEEDSAALKRGAENLAAHLDIVHEFGIPCVVAVNQFPADSEDEVSALRDLAFEMGAEQVVVNEGFQRGGEGAEALAQAVVEMCDRPNSFRPVNRPGAPIYEQIKKIATRLYGADGIELFPEAQRQLAKLERRGLAELPVCMAKTHLSISHDPTQKGRPRGFRLPVRNLFPSVGAGFVVALCGDVMLMPGLGREPALRNIDVDVDGRTVGLF
jgi:formyltetrahydrofolate synthetase